jgi:hypothetical protein
MPLPWPPPVVGVQIDDFPFAETPTPFQDPSELDGYESKSCLLAGQSGNDMLTLAIS